MKEVIPEHWMWRHLWLHMATLLAALLAFFWDTATWLLILGLSLQGVVLSFAIFTGIMVYRRTYQRLAKV